MKIWSGLKLKEVKFEKDLAEGVHYAEKSYENDLGKNVDLYVITVSAEAKARMAAWAAPWCTTKHIVDQCREMKEAGKEVLFACNAGYFHLSAGTLDPYGIQIVDGKVRRLAKPKKKKLKHLKLLSGCLDKLAEKIKAGKTIHDSEIRSALRNFSEEKEEADV